MTRSILTASSVAGTVTLLLFNIRNVVKPAARLSKKCTVQANVFVLKNVRMKLNASPNRFVKLVVRNFHIKQTASTDSAPANATMQANALDGIKNVKFVARSSMLHLPVLVKSFAVLGSAAISANTVSSPAKCAVRLSRYDLTSSRMEGNSVLTSVQQRGKKGLIILTGKAVTRNGVVLIGTASVRKQGGVMNIPAKSAAYLRKNLASLLMFIILSLGATLEMTGNVLIALTT